MSRYLCALLVAATSAALPACGGCESGPSAADPTAPAEPERVASRPADPPSAEGAMAPALTPDGDAVLATWLEPTATGHRLRFARFADGRWEEPRTVVASDRAFANWADFPRVVRSGDGSLIAHWLRRSGDAPYAYDVVLMRSTDGGRQWTELGKLHDDATESEHGFVSSVPTAGGLRMFWLDGRATAGGEEHGGPMMLRTAEITGAEIGPSELVDDRVCDCCQTAAAGPSVFYRDRSDGEVRDVVVARRTEVGFRTSPLGAHGWEMRGCPVNGPAADGGEGGAVVAWYSGGGEAPGVHVAFSQDAASFGEPAQVDGPDALGRVDVARAGDGAIVSWLAAGGPDGAARVRLRRIAADGAAGPAVTVATTGSERASGFPQIAPVGEELLVAWVQTGRVSRVRSVLVRLGHVPAAGR